MKWVPCPRCGLSDVAVANDFDETEDFAPLCERCEREMDEQFESSS